MTHAAPLRVGARNLPTFEPSSTVDAAPSVREHGVAMPGECSPGSPLTHSSFTGAGAGGPAAAGCGAWADPHFRSEEGG